MSDLVSVIIPCYNKEKHVREAIQSALDQTYPHCEVIVVDDGSTDGSLAIVESFGEKIRWTTGPNRGGCAARNRGLEMAQGRWVQFLDADDVMTCGKIEKQCAALQGCGPGAMATCGVKMLWHDGTTGPLTWQDQWQSGMRGIDLLVEMWLGGTGLTIHSWLTPLSLIREQGGWLESLAAGQDIEFFGRLLVATQEVIPVKDEGAVVFYRASDGTTVSANGSYRSRKSLLEAWKTVEKLISAERTDLDARRAALRYLRVVGLAASRHPEILKEITEQEQRLGLRDFDFNVSWKRGLLFGLLGIEKTLKLRRWIGR